MQEQTIFDLMYEPFKINKPIRLIELFAGIGSQATALKRIGVPFEQYRISEWAVKSILAYKNLHHPNDNYDYSKDHTKEQLVETLYNIGGISSNYNEPMTKQQIAKLDESKLREIYNAMVVTKNLGNIQNITAERLGIENTDIYIYICTYSFPCQDLSLAGKGKGMSDTSTRSGMLWEVERLLSETKEKPQVLIMENVVDVHNERNKDDFKKWILRLEELGYKNYFQDLIATDYGIPQTRNRCFMVSLLGDYSYSFPQKQKLDLKLKDLLEENVDKKYFLSDRMMNYIFPKDDKYQVNENSLQINREIAVAKTTREGCTRADTSDYIGVIDSYNKKETNPNYAGTIVAGQGRNQGSMLLIKNATKKGYSEASVGDGIDISGRMEHHRGTVQKGKSQTLNTYGGENVGVVVKPQVLGGIGAKDSNNNTQWKQQNRIYKDDVAIAVTTICNPYYQNDLRIRKLSPRECGRLMGFNDEEITLLSKGQSDSSLYHLFGDSIVVNVIEAVMKQLF